MNLGKSETQINTRDEDQHPRSCECCVQRARESSGVKYTRKRKMGWDQSTCCFK